MILEIKTGETWSELIPASKVLFSTPSETEVGRAFVTAQVPIGSYVRWHIFIKGGFDYYGEPEKVSINSFDEAQSLLKAKAAADLKAKDAAAKAAAIKKTTIVCTKGKLTKKVTAVKPKCPAGYKVKK
jgi:topoisomerase IA-like protein